MKIDLSKLDRAQFSFKAGSIAATPCILVEPKSMGSVKWDYDNLIFRSSIWSADGELISAGMKKFFNSGEATNLFPTLTYLDDAEAMEKLDGSSLIISHYKGQRVMRTRGTFDANLLANGAEVPALIEQHKEFLDYCAEYPRISFICEWYSPSCKIVINYGEEPKLWLIGAINHEDYNYVSQKELDRIATLTGMARPRRFSFNSIEQMGAAMQSLRGEEGYCVYSNNGQRIDKYKTPHYLILHKMKSDLSNFDKLVTLWLDIGRPNYGEFYKYIADNFDYELAEYCRGEISKICDAYVVVKNIIAGFEAFVAKLQGLSRKEQAEKVIAAYGQTNRAGFVFKVLDGKGVNDEAVKKLILQSM